MAIPIWSDIEKLITEHGSATIKQAHIELLREQIAIRDRRITDLTNQNGTLESRINDLELEAKNHQRLIDNLTKQTQQTKPTTEDRHDIQHRVLLLLSDGNEHPTKKVAIHLDIREQLAKYHLTELLKDDMVRPVSYGFDNDHWQLWPNGRDYLAKRDLLK